MTATSAGTARRKYTAVFDWIETGTWEVGLVEDPRVRAYGSTVEQARDNLREVLRVVLGVGQGAPGPGSDVFDLVDDVRLPRAVGSVVEQACNEREIVRRGSDDARRAREELAATMAKAVAATRRAARLLGEHAAIVEAEANADRPARDLQLPLGTLDAMATAQTVLVEVGHARERSVSNQKALAAAEQRALETHRTAVVLLVRECRLTVAEAGLHLGLPGDRTAWLLRTSGDGPHLVPDQDSAPREDDGRSRETRPAP